MSERDKCREFCMHRLSIHGDLESIEKDRIAESVSRTED